MTEHDHRDVLLKAASLVEEGWLQGTYSDKLATDYDLLGDFAGATRRCALGAIFESTFYLVGEDEPLAQDAQEHLVDSLGVDHRLDVAGWNDAEGRTQAEVAEALRKAADA